MTIIKAKSQPKTKLPILKVLLIMGLIQVVILAIYSDSILHNNSHDVDMEVPMPPMIRSGVATQQQTDTNVNTNTAPSVKSNKKDEKEKKAVIPIQKRYANKGAEAIWKSLLQKGQQLMQQNADKKSPLVVMEVGAHSINQSVQAAQHDFTVHVIEPSPSSFDKMTKQLLNQPTEIQRKIALYNKAAGSDKASSNTLLDFAASGGTGDHVGNYDMWNMVQGLDQEQDLPEHKRSKMVQVQSIQLDEVIQNVVKPDFTTANTAQINNGIIDEEVYLIKIDTQGFEPNVFRGLQHSIQNHRIKYVLTEWWPKGIHLLQTGSTGGSTTSPPSDEDSCHYSTIFLKMLHEAGYKLYGTAIQAHPQAPKEARQFMNAHKTNHRPFEDDEEEGGVEKFCDWLYDIEEKFPSEEYHMGYWTDIVAVSPEEEEGGKLLLDLENLLS